MTRNLVIALGLVAVALPALGQQQAYDYQDEYSSAWNEESAGDAYQEVPDASVTFDTFRDGLAQYGEWVNVPTYGQVWRPARVTAGWRPYLHGRWEWTDGGWLWVSDEPWGWAAYHYGRWAADSNYGWIWVPDYNWAPAWVTWRYSADYVGWAPLAPGVSVYTTAYPVDYGSWSFVPCNRFVGAPVYSVAYSGTDARGIFHSTVPAPPRAATYGMPAPAWGGPARPFIEARVGHSVAPVHLQPVASPSAIAVRARAGVVPIYRPEFRSPTAGRPSMAMPARPWGATGTAASRAGFVAPVRPQGGGFPSAHTPPNAASAWRGGAGGLPYTPATAGRPSMAMPARPWGATGTGTAPSRAGFVAPVRLQDGGFPSAHTPPNNVSAWRGGTGGLPYTPVPAPAPRQYAPSPSAPRSVPGVSAARYSPPANATAPLPAATGYSGRAMGARYDQRPMVDGYAPAIGGRFARGAYTAHSPLGNRAVAAVTQRR